MRVERAERLGTARDARVVGEQEGTGGNHRVVGGLEAGTVADVPCEPRAPRRRGEDEPVNELRPLRSDTLASRSVDACEVIVRVRCGDGACGGGTSTATRVGFRATPAARHSVPDPGLSTLPDRAAGEQAETHRKTSSQLAPPWPPRALPEGMLQRQELPHRGTSRAAAVDHRSSRQGVCLRISPPPSRGARPTLMPGRQRVDSLGAPILAARAVGHRACTRWASTSAATTSAPATAGWLMAASPKVGGVLGVQRPGGLDVGLVDEPAIGCPMAARRCSAHT
jgi:hypothetical protein